MRVYEVRGAQGAVRVAGGGGSGSSGGQGQREGSCDVAVRRGEEEEEKDGCQGRHQRRQHR